MERMYGENVESQSNICTSKSPIIFVLGLPKIEIGRPRATTPPAMRQADICD
jgi:hypothetical protein